MKTLTRYFIFLTLTLLVILASMTVYTTESETVSYNFEAEKAIALMQHLVPGFPTAEDGYDTVVTREDFVKYVADLYKLDFDTQETGVYTDVSEDDAAFNEIYHALQQGWITANEKFYPDNPIRFDEAIKILVCAANYELEAADRGGFPYGYIETAQRLGITQFMQKDTGNTLTEAEAALMLYRLMCLDEVVSYVSNDEVTYMLTSQTNLYTLHNLRETEGMITATEFTSIYPNVESADENHIEVDGITYLYEGDSENLIGQKAAIFYTETSGVTEAVLVVPERPVERMIELDDIIEVDGNTITYYVDTQKRSASFKNIIFNGKSVANIEAVAHLLDCGRLLAVSYDSTSVYDLAIIESFRYMIADNVNPVDKSIGDSNQMEDSLILTEGDDDCTVILQDADGTELDFYDLSAGDLLAVYESLDKTLIKLIVCEENGVSGTLEVVNAQDKTVRINGTEYELSDYCVEHDMTKLVPGASGYFTIGPDGKIVTLMGSADRYVYAYAIDAAKSGGFDDMVQLKLYTLSGNIEVMSLSDKVNIDGEAGGDPLSVYDILKDNPQLIKYRVTSENLINGIDFADRNTENVFEEEKDPDNSLTQYEFAAETLLYRSEAKSFVPYFHISNAIVMKIPNDITSEEDYIVGNYSLCVNDKRYSAADLQIYDLDQTGGAGIMIVRYDPVVQEYGSADKSYIVEEIVQTINQDGVQMASVECWADGLYYSFYLPETIAIAKESGNGLVPGDIFRAVINNRNEIIAISVDVDASLGTPIANGLSQGNFYGQNVAATYYLGKVYFWGDSYAYISATQDIFGEYDYSFSHLYNCNTGTNLIKFDPVTKTLHPIAAEEIRSYVNYGEDNHFVVLRQNRFKGNSVFVYEQGGEL